MKHGSFDIIGSIAILPLYTKNAKKTAKKIMSEHKNVRTVLLKAEKIKGRLRKRKLRFIAGVKTKETIYKESGCLMKMDVEECYFSPRLSNDRIDIMKKVKKGEKVLVMFSGVAPYALVIAKHKKPEVVYAVELNKKAHEYALENIRLNKLGNVIAIQGDAKRIIPKLRKKIRFDRIVMARPQLKDTFLKEAISIAKKGCIIHFYDFLIEKEIPDKALDKIQMECEKSGKKFKTTGWKKAGEIAPRKYRIRADFVVV